MNKTVAFKTPGKPAPSAEEAWLKARKEEAAAEPAPAMVATATAPVTMKRFTIDVPDSLHRRIKTECAARGTKMADVIRALLEREFPSAER